MAPLFLYIAYHGKNLPFWEVCDLGTNYAELKQK